ncbi:hypothetical protein B7463_g9538, partial [Scytalidium lignicola]
MTSVETGLEIGGGGLLSEGVRYGIVGTPTSRECLLLQIDPSAVFSSRMWINGAVFAYVQAYNCGIAAPMWWGSQTRRAAIMSSILGLATGLAVWISTKYTLYGDVTIALTLESAPALYGAIGSLFKPVLIISYARPSTFEWQ